MASTGLSFDARMAGIIPAKMPVIIDSVMPVKKLLIVKYIGKSAALEIAILVTQTSIMPAKPPIKLNTTDSYKN